MTTFTTDYRIEAERDPNDYDYTRYEEIILKLLEESEAQYIDPDYLEIGEDLSNISAVKIIFDGFGDLETEDEYIEAGNRDMRSFAIFIHVFKFSISISGCSIIPKSSTLERVKENFDVTSFQLSSSQVFRNSYIAPFLLV